MCMSVYTKRGKWYCLFMLNNKRKHLLCVDCKTETEAKNFEAEQRLKLKEELKEKSKLENIITIGELFQNYLDYSETNKKTYNCDICNVNILKQYFNVNKSISTITPELVEQFKTKIMKDRGISKSRTNTFIKVISKSFKLMIIGKRLNIQNPCDYVQRFKEDNHIIRYLTEEEEKRLMKAVKGTYLEPIVVVALQTGLRLQNILQLKWSSINFDIGFIEILMQENKGHKKIQLPMSKTLQKTLQSLKNNYEYVFINPRTKKPYTTIKKSFKTALKTAKISNFRFHDLRHTVATRLVMNGTDLRTVKEFMAHSDIKTTQRYMHPTPENMLKAVNILDNFSKKK